MAISYLPGSASLKITTKPGVKTPEKYSTDMEFNSVAIEASAECQLTGIEGDNPAGWTLGFIQVQFLETNWGYYRGAIDADGSAYVNRGSSTLRGATHCRDTKSKGEIWFQNLSGKDLALASNGKLPMTLKVQLMDGPHETYPLYHMNSLTKKYNFLREVQLEFHFCTVLALMNPSKQYQFLKHFLWNMHWQATFQPSSFTDSDPTWTVMLNSNKLANSGNCSQIAEGGPIDPKIKAVLTDPTAANCNEIAGLGAAAKMMESRSWVVARS
ncbi:MAG: hypothetical protein JST93_26490 [Acidobacteria bacterium]|nr:hypothetical protein [Acidobacteriota bacterium]